MSNKTIIENPSTGKSGAEYKSCGSESTFYGRSSDASTAGKTVIQGVSRSVGTYGEKSTGTSSGEYRRDSGIELQDRPVMGIFFTVSLDQDGEIFPLYAGRNIIGNGQEADVRLYESSVSSRHAAVMIRVIGNAVIPKISISLTDLDSEFGTFVNGERLGFEKIELKGGEIIRIGNACELYYHPLCPSILGLEKARDAQPLPRESKPFTNLKAIENPGMTQGNNSDSASMPPIPKEVYPTSVGAQDEFSFYGRTKPLKKDHSSQKTQQLFNGGKTVLK